MPPLDKDEDGSIEESLALLSPEERAAILGDDEDAAIAAALTKTDDGSDAELAAAAKEDDDDDDATDDDDADDADDTDSDDDADDTAAAAADKAAAPVDEAAKEEAQHEIATVDAPPLNLAPVEQDYRAALATLNEEKAEKFQAMMDGDLPAAEYAKYEADYLSRRDALGEDRANATAWFKEVHQFKTDKMGDGVNYHADAEKVQAWDDWIKRLASKPEHAGKEGRWFLEQAHKKVLAEFDVDVSHVSNAKSQQLPQKNAGKSEGKAPAKPAGRAPKLDKIPPSLGGLPAAEEADQGDDGEFAHLSKLSGMELERAVSRMTPEQEERYLRGA